MSESPFAEALKPLAARMPPVVREREILRVAASLKGEDSQEAASAARLEVLRWLRNRAGGQLPAAAWEHEPFEHLAGGRNCTGVRIIDQGRDTWAVRADDPDKTVPRRVWTTEVTVGHAPDHKALFSLRLLVSSPEAEMHFDPAVPGLVQQIADQCGLQRGDFRLTSEPWLVRSAMDAESLITILVNPGRDIPVFVLSVPEDAVDSNKPLIDAPGLARALIGLARVVILPAAFTWELTDRFGKRLSVFGGAARTYLPGFTEDSDPYGHELLLAEMIAAPECAKIHKARMQMLAARNSLNAFRLGYDVLSFTTVREANFDRTREELEERGAADTEKLAAAQAQIAALKDDLNKAIEFQQWLSDEHNAAEERATTAEERVSIASYRIRQLTEQLKERGQDPDARIPLPEKWEGVTDWCEQYLIGRVTLSGRARREVRDPIFQDVATAAKCLLWLANEYRERRISGGGGDLRVGFDVGLKNERCGADNFSIDWRGKRTEVRWHIKNGGNTRDPSRCLRIYYFWDEISQQVVIASMPGHIRTGAT